MADKQLLFASSDVSFSDSSYPLPIFVFEMDDRRHPDELTTGKVRIRKYPAVSDRSWNDYLAKFGITSTAGERWDAKLKYVATEGTVTVMSETRERTITARVMLSGTTRTSLQYPVVRDLQFSLDGECYDNRGSKITPALSFDADANAIVSQVEVYGVLVYTYVTTYKILEYTPNAHLQFEMYYLPDPADYGNMLVFVTDQPTKAKWAHINEAAVPPPIPPIIFSIQPPSPVASEFEVYRVESTVIINDGGEWEKPMGWPTIGTYPSSTQVCDPAGSNLEVARVHEIAYFTLRNADRQSGYVASERLPLNYTKEYTDRGKTARQTEYIDADGKVTTKVKESIKEKSEDYYKAYDKIMQERILMRRQKQLVDITQPYDTADNVRYSREWRVLEVTDARGTTTRVKTATDFRIILRPKPATRPTIATPQSGSAPQRREPGDTDYTKNKQGMILNAHLSRIWEGVDWMRLKAEILEAYDAEIYRFDWSQWPTAN